MIKWSEFFELGVLFEAFLPEHERERHAWLLRVSRNGHILEERYVGLTWPPRFGPDAGDVAVLEGELDGALARVGEGRNAPLSPGDYVPRPSEVADTSPWTYAVLHQLLSDYVE